MIGEASQLGVQTTTVNKLLDKMGYHPEKRVVDISRGGTGGPGIKKEKETFRPQMDASKS